MTGEVSSRLARTMRFRSFPSRFASAAEAATLATEIRAAHARPVVRSILKGIGNPLMQRQIVILRSEAFMKH
jgi:hypothetical protein